jgi:hypothetical protein
MGTDNLNQMWERMKRNGHRGPFMPFPTRHDVHINVKSTKSDDVKKVMSEQQDEDEDAEEMHLDQQVRGLQLATGKMTATRNR